MFKYIWLIMIILAFGIFVVYTIYCCIQELHDIESLEDWIDNMDIAHEWLLPTWGVIFIITMALLFLASFISFTSSFG